MSIKKRKRDKEKNMYEKRKIYEFEDQERPSGRWMTAPQ
jgi:hypothetical protein